MAEVIKTASDLSCVRNGETTEPAADGVGGPGTGTSYNNTEMMTFPDFGIPSCSVIDSAELTWTLIDADWSVNSYITVSACLSYDPATVNGINQPAPVGTPNATYVTYQPGAKVMNATGAVRQMLASGIRCLKLTQPNGENRKRFSSTTAVLTISYHLPVWIAPVKGSINKPVLSMKATPVKGSINKTVAGMKIAPVRGSADKTVF